MRQSTNKHQQKKNNSNKISQTGKMSHFFTVVHQLKIIIKKKIVSLYTVQIVKYRVCINEKKNRESDWQTNNQTLRKQHKFYFIF